jgi:GT2 family glycosyltransferase
MDSVSVVIPTFRRPGALRATLGAILGVDHPAHELEVIVVDDSGGDRQTEQVIQELRSSRVPLRFLVQENAGAAAARNAGAGMATGEWLFFCDDDIVVRPDHIRMHLETHRRHDAEWVGGQREYSPETFATLSASPFGRFWLRVEDRWAAWGPPEHAAADACIETLDLPSYDLSMRSDLFHRLGRFDDEYPGGTLEDHDFSLRARAAGCSLVRNNAIVVLHNDPTTTLEGACRRETSRAAATVLLAEKHPERAPLLAIVNENSPASRDDGWRLRVKKSVKGALSEQAALTTLHRVVRMAERARLPDRALFGLYRVLIGLHIHRGVRGAIASRRSSTTGAPPKRR